ncbi:hypothetical protein D3C72_2338800 [compost metagenome]
MAFRYLDVRRQTRILVHVTYRALKEVFDHGSPIEQLFILDRPCKLTITVDVTVSLETPILDEDVILF